MARFGFCGPSYQAENVAADAQRLLNMYQESDGSGAGKSAVSLLPSPGLQRFAVLPENGYRRAIEILGRCFVVCGAGFYEVFADGTNIKRGTVNNDGLPASMAASNVQVMIASGRHGYCFTLATNAFVADPANLVTPLRMSYIDGFFLSQQADSNKFQYSNALDGTTWQGANATAISVFGENLVSSLADHREFFVVGNKRATVYYDSGNTFTFDVVPGGFAEQGGAAAFCVDRFDNTFAWLGVSERGDLKAWKISGYQPVRFSTHAVELAWRGYPKVSDAVSFAWAWNGHEFWRINFPSANAGRGATWEYDAATQQWHELCWRDPASGIEYAHRAQCHVYCFGKHLVGDSQNGILYEMNDSFVTDDGNPIKRLRDSPWISAEGERIFHRSLQIDAQMGLGPIVPLVDGAGNPRGPQGLLQWTSNGKTYSQGRILDFGQVGQYDVRAIAYQLGQDRNRSYRFSTIDPFSLRITDAYLDASGWGQKPTQRLSEKLRQGA